MFSVPSVTMKGGSLMRVTSRPLAKPNSVVTAIPASTASGGATPRSVANLVITMPPSAITMPHDKSMPAVRITSVWPIAMTPTTITCCSTSDRLPPVRKRSLCEAKKAHAASSARNGPSVPSGGSRCFNTGLAPSLLSPAQIGAGGHVFALDARLRLGGDQCDAGVGVPARLLAALGVFDARVDTHRSHLQRVLLRGGRDHAGADVLHAFAAAVDADDHHAFLLAGLLQRVVRAGRCRLVDGVDQVHVGCLLQAIFHRGLALGLVAIAVGHAGHRGVLAEIVALRI